MDGQGPRRRAVDLLIHDLGGIGHDLRRYLDEGETLIRKVKPPDVKAARDLFEQIIARIGNVSAKLADEHFLSSDIPPAPLANGPITPNSQVDVSKIVHHQQQFVLAEIVEASQAPQQVQRAQEPVQRDQLQSQQQQNHSQGQHEVQLQPKLQPLPLPQHHDQQPVQQNQLQGQQKIQLQPQQAVEQQVQLQHQRRDQLHGQQEVQLHPQQPLQQHYQLPEQLHNQQGIQLQSQQQNQHNGQQQVQQEQKTQSRYQQQEYRPTETVPEAVPEAVPNTGVGAVNREESPQPGPPTQDEIHAALSAPRRILPAPFPTTNSIPTNSSISCVTGPDVGDRSGEPTRLRSPKLLLLHKDSAPLFDCTYQDIHVLNEELFEQCSLHPDVHARGYFKLQVRDLPSLQVGKMGRLDQNHATSFVYRKDNLGLIKVDTGKKPRIRWPKFPLPTTEKQNWSFKEQKHLWNSTAAHPPNGARPYIIGNPLFDDVELSPGDKLRRRGPTVLEGINTQYIYFNLTGKTITVMHREDAHVRSENLLRAGENKFWCFIKPSSTAKLEERMRQDFPEMRGCSQALRHLSRHIPPAKLDEWGVEYTLDYCVPGQAVVTEPGTYHQVLNLGPNYAIAINVEYNSSPDDPPNYTFCDEACPDQFAISAQDFRINSNATAMDKMAVPAKTKPMTMMAQPKQPGAVSPRRRLSNDYVPSDSAPATGQHREQQHPVSGPPPQKFQDAKSYYSRQLESAVLPSMPSTVSSPVHERPQPDISEASASVFSPGRVDRGPLQVAFEQQQVITEPEALPEVQQAATGVQQIISEPEAPQDIRQTASEQLSIQPRSQTAVFHQHQEQADMAQSQPVILNPSQARALGHSADHYQEHSRVQATFPLVQQSTAPPRGVIGPKPLFNVPDLRFVGPPVLQPFDGAIRAFDRDLQTQTFSVQQASYGTLQPPPAIKPSSFPAQIIQSYVHQTSESPPILNNVAASGVGLKRPAETPIQSSVKRTKPNNEATSFGHLADLLRTAKSPPVEQVWSKAAFLRLAGLVRDWREYSRSVPISGGGFDLLDHVDDAEQISQELQVFLRRFLKMKLSEYIESTAQVNGLKDVFDCPVSSHIDWGEIFRKLNWDVTGRNQLNDYVREGKCWRTICGEYNGLLCLLPSDDRFLELAMFKDQLAHFHAQLSTKAVRRMCTMGQTLEKSIWEYLELPEFSWESVDTSELSLDEIWPLLSQFKLIKTNHYDRLKYNWEIQPPPLGWTDPWPSDPMSVAKSDKKACSLCNNSKRMTTEKSSCKCLVKRLPQIPRITQDGSRGEGVRAIGSFKADECLGELVGELRPPRTAGTSCSSDHNHPNISSGQAQLNNHNSNRHNHEWAMEVRRPDLHDQLVADIYPQQMGNWVRKVRHDGVSPSAVFKVMKITGKWRVMLVAMRDIRDGDEITAKYGRGYRKEQPSEVVEGLH
ncbi:SET-8 [Neurospora crassa OR74A]|uniref:SET-8 n=2 Tax=Neurospora crassa TaxID=5141 RepID=Q7SE87_NEUCR|nr:SET-8 [Neurospora crassa OR74A]EAA35101.1 SET-8 [Neurospora crassa OR74A]CAE76378.1 hypothetical protein [Neurospora crassa]|eukprot:XP_964337.1 SET-8 [Neurospora crassa OR74A]